MCTTFKEATLLVPALKHGLCHYPSPPNDVHLGSAFALQCAKEIRYLSLGPEVFQLQGWAAFGGAAKQMTRLDLRCSSVLEAAQAELMMQQCGAITALLLSGSHMPALLPSAVTELTAIFGPPPKCGCHTTQLDALIYRAALLPQLRRLEIELCATGQPAALLLQAPVQLPVLHTLVIFEVQLSAPEIDLRWVQRQPCSILELNMIADTPDIAKHAAVVKQLSLMTISSLSLDSKVPFTSELQAL